MTADPGPFVHLRQEGVSLLLDLTGSQLPAVLHWGEDLGPLTVEDARGIARGVATMSFTDLPDDPMRLSLLPAHRIGWAGRPGLSGSRGGRDWSPAFSTDTVTVDGDPVDGLVERGAATVQVQAADPVAGLGLVLWVELAAGGVVRCRAELSNTGADGYQVDDLVLALPVPEQAREILDFAGRWGKERTPQRLPLVVGAHVRQGRRGRTGADAATVLHVGTPGFDFADGRVWGVHVGWSGNHTHYAERMMSGEQVLGGGELLMPGEVVLDHGESYTTPWLHGSYGVGLDEVARRFHRFLRARERPVDTARPVTLNVWEAVYFDHDRDRLLDLADRAAALGVERFVLDDGWFGARRDPRAGLGDWVVSPDVWPDGLHPLIDRVTGHGMQFGLWFEPEMVNMDSDLAREHPEWVMQTGDRLPVEGRHQQVVDLAIEECYAHVRDQMMAILDEYAIAYIKWDHNRDLIDAGNALDGGRPATHAQTAACYRLMDELRAAHPTLEIESCSSGGARVDLGVLERTDRVWVSDCIDPLERLDMHRWTTQLVPPEYMGSHIASGRSHTTHRTHDLSFRAATAVFGHLGLEWDLARATEAELAEVTEWIAWYKEQRDFLLAGDLVRLDYPDPSVHAFGVVAPDRSRALYEIASAARSEVFSTGRLPLRGLDPTRRYRIAPEPVSLRQRVKSPPWWGPKAEDGSYPGVVLPGSALAAGIRMPELDSEHAVILSVQAED